MEDRPAHDRGFRARPFVPSAWVLLLAACGAPSTVEPATPSTSPTLDAGTASSSDAAAASDAGALADSDAATPAASETATLHFIGSAYTLYASIGGGAPHIVQLDTGSIGLYVPKSTLGPTAQISQSETCTITYVSSGVTLSGHAATSPVTLLGASRTGDVPAPPTTVAMPLCAIDDPTWAGGMMGVGYGRGGGADPTRNVLLQVAAIKTGKMHAGYVLSTVPTPSVRIGLTPDDGQAFRTVALTPSSTFPGDWLSTSLRGCLALPDAPSFTPLCGPLLVDTGVSDCLLWGAKDATLGGVIPAGQTAVPTGVRLRITAEGSPDTLTFAFASGAGADAPTAVRMRAASAFSINTGRALLVDDDYLFDAENGRVGFRAH